jgi:phage terminase Nu1 subunit (DNA packaging protein)
VDRYDRFVNGLEGDEFTREEIAVLVGKSVDTIKAWSRSANITPHRGSGRRLVFSKYEFAALLRQEGVIVLG